RLAEIAPAALAETLRQLAAGVAPRTPQDNNEASYAPKLEREHGLIDWSQPAELIERMIRAYDPWPGTYTMIRDGSGAERKLKIFSATLVEDAVADGIVIRCGAGALRLAEVQLEGKKRMSGAEFARGHPSFSFPTSRPSA
ncbi:MAG TPA: hypothetical protein VGC85_00170, partial [Chthoniobacterales bacterium]